jgi:hypothetical protein
MRSALLLLIEVRFGKPAPELTAAVEALAGRTDLDRVLERALTARSLEALLTEG